MKKITFLILFFLGVTSIQAQENLLSNGDFEQGMVTWFGNAFNVQEDGGNNFNLSDNEVSGNPFDVNLSHPVALEGGVTYTFSFDASTSMEDGSRTIIAGIGLNEGDFSAATEVVTVTSETQTYTLTLTPPAGSANSRALFDLGADDGVLVIDNVVLTVEETMTNEDNLLSNGDFEQGMVTWFGNAFNVVEDGGNSFNQSDNEVSGNPFDVNLSHPVALEGGVTYTFSFDASTSMEDGSRTIIAGIGLNEGDFSAATEVVTVTSELQTYTLTLTPPAGSANSRALFDLGADDGVLVLDNVILTVEETMNEEGELLENGDFELGMVTWFGNAFNVVEDGGNNFNQSDNEVSGNPFDVNLSHPVALEAGVAYTFSFDASTSMEDGTRTIIAGIGLNEGDFSAATEVVTVTSELQNYSFTLTPPAGSANSRVLFDLGADDGVLVLDNVSLMVADGGGGDPMMPIVAAPTPPNRDEDAVFSIFSNAYNNQPGVVFGAFDVGTQDIQTIQIEGDDTQQIAFTQPDPQFLLVDWGTIVDNTAMTHFHMDYWISTDLATGLIANPALSNHVGDAGETSVFGLTNPVTTFGEWVSVDVPLENFDFGDNTQQRDALRQFVLTVAGADNGTRTVFLDNIYLHNNTTSDTGGNGDELLENGDFELGMVTWFGNAFNVVEDGGNNFNLSDNEVSGNPFDVNLSHPVALEAGVAYTFSFDASTSMEDGSRTIIAGIGLNEGDFASATEVVTVTSDTQTFTFTLTPPSGSANSRVLFDLGADDGILVLDNVSLMVADEGEEPEIPLEAAPTPPNRAEDAVFSIFSNAYNNQPDVVFGAFNVGTQDIQTIQIEGDDTQQIAFTQPDPQFLLVDWGTIVDNTAMTHFHMDYWISTDLATGLIANPALSNHVGDAGETSVFGLTNPVTTFGEWVSVDVPLENFDFGDNTQQRDALRQFVLTVAGADNGTRTVFLDNIYLHNNTTLSTEEFTAVDISVYPNPSIDNWTITSNADIITSVEVYDLLGKRVAVASPEATTFDIDASTLRRGLYIATITTNRGQETIKLIKR